MSTATRVRRDGGGMRIQSAVLLLGLVACAGPTSPIPEQGLTLEVWNAVAQQRVGDATTESSSVVFCVKAASDVGADALADIRSMSVEWPGRSRWTPVAGGSDATSEPPAACTWRPAALVLTRGAAIDRLVAYAQVPQVGLAVGTYMLHVAFEDGGTAESGITYDGRTMDPPAAVTLSPTTLGVGIAWDAPAVDLGWRLDVTSLEAGTTLGQGPTYWTAGGHTSGWVKTALARGTPYLLGLLIVSPFNSRYMTLPFTVP